MEVLAGQVRPQNLPQFQYVDRTELALEEHQQPPEAEEHIAGIVSVQVIRQLRLRGAQQGMQLAQLRLHAFLVHLEVSALFDNNVDHYHHRLTVIIPSGLRVTLEAYHFVHEPDETPERVDLVVHEEQDRTEEITHTLNVA